VDQDGHVDMQCMIIIKERKKRERNGGNTKWLKN